jgi:hypothetical protein
MCVSIYACPHCVWSRTLGVGQGRYYELGVTFYRNIDGKQGEGIINGKKN